jgi:S1-C subfamily serine protease
MARLWERGRRKDVALAALVAVGVFCSRPVFMPNADAAQNPAVARIVFAGALVIGQGVCSGTFISPRDVITADHCVAGLKRTDSLTVTDVKGQETPAEIVKEDGPKDLALIRLIFPDANVVPAALGVADGATWGEEVWTLGSPAGEPFMLMHGYVAKIQVFASSDPCSPNAVIGTGKIQRLYLDMRVFFGNSGGGLFDDQGRLIGVVTELGADEFGKKTTKDDPNGCKSEPIGLYVLWGLAVGPQPLAEFLTE